MLRVTPRSPKTATIGRVPALIQELKRRRVVRLLIAYGAVALMVLGGLDTVIDTYGLPSWVQRAVGHAVLFGLLATVVLGWVFDLTSGGPHPTSNSPKGKTRAAGILGYGVVTVAVLGVMVGAFWLSHPGRAGDSVIADARVIAVAPFTTSGEATTYLSEGMVDLLGTNLGEVGEIRTVSSRTVLNRWRTRTAGGEPGLASILAIGRDAGAGSVLSGSVVQAGDQLRISSELLRLDGMLLASATVTGPSDDPLALVDELSLALLREIWSALSRVPEPRVASVTSSSLEAVRAYLRGETVYRRAQWGPAVREYTRAVEADTLFALAYARLSEAWAWQETLGSRNALRFGEEAYRLRDRLPARVHRLVVADRLSQRDPYGTAASDSLRSYLSDHPDDVFATHKLGDHVFHRVQRVSSPELVGHAWPDGDLVFAEAEKIARLDSLLTPAFVHPTQHAVQTGDSAAFGRFHGLLSLGAYPVTEPLDTLGRALWRVPEARSNALLGLVRAGATLWALQAVQGSFELSVGHPSDFVAGLERGLRFVPRPTVTQFWTSRAMLLTSTGRMRAAADTARDGAVDRATAGHYLHGAPAVAGFLPAERALDSFARLDPGDVDEALVALTVADAHIASGELDEAFTALSSAESLLGRSDRAGSRDGVLAGLVEASHGWIALERGDTAVALQRMQEGLGQAGRWDGRAVTIFPSDPLGTTGVSVVTAFKMVAAMASWSATRSAGLPMLEGALWPDSHYRVLRHLELGRARERAGDADGARNAYRQFVHLLEGADPGLPIENEVAEARSAIARLGG
jgi:TolB-like protein